MKLQSLMVQFEGNMMWRFGLRDFPIAYWYWNLAYQLISYSISVQYSSDIYFFKNHYILKLCFKSETPQKQEQIHNYTNPQLSIWSFISHKKILSKSNSNLPKELFLHYPIHHFFAGIFSPWVSDRCHVYVIDTPLLYFKDTVCLINYISAH